MRPHLLAFSILHIGVFCVGASAADIWRPPLLIPQGCSDPTFEMVLIDVSRSMTQADQFSKVQESVAGRIRSQVPNCTLEIVASFGLTADVSGAEFLVGPESREKLIRVVQALKPEHRSTNLDEAARLIELLSFQLRDAFGVSAGRLVVRVYSDFESSPSTGKHKFSLGEYLARRMGARYVNVPAKDGVYEQTVRVPGRQKGTESRHQPSEPLKVPHAIVGAAVGGGVVLLVVLIALFWLRPRPGDNSTSVRGLTALLVTEAAVNVDGSPAALGVERRVEITAGVPALFSTDANSATYVVAELPGAVTGELFRIEALLDGKVLIQSPHSRLTVNEEPLDVSRRRKVDAREPIHIRLGRREFRIALSQRSAEHRRGPELFDAQPLQH